MNNDNIDVAEYTYEYYEERKPVIIPESLEDLRKALSAKAEIQEMIDRHMPDDAGGYIEIMAVQEQLIKTYVNSLGSFDNSILINNIAFLTRKHDIRLGDLESLLGISAGYISRTAKENSGKRMSIDIAWKIARLFNIDFGRLINVNLAEDKGNTAVLVKFIEKMIRQTEDGKLQWESMGGAESELDPALVDCGLVTENGDTIIYNSARFNQRLTFHLYGDVMRTCEFDEDGNDMLMIPFRREGDNKTHYDFLTSWDGDYHHGDAGIQWEKMFYTFDDPFGRLDEAATRLYDMIQHSELDAKLNPDVRSFIDRYIEEED